MTDDIHKVASYIEAADPRFHCIVDERMFMIILTSDSRPDVPEGINVLPLYYRLRLKRGKLDNNDLHDMLKDAKAFADKSYLN